jgi:hypothetical protein
MSEALAALMEGDERIVHVESSAVGIITKSEVEAQLDAAHKYPRSIKRFIQESISLATLTQEVAESCIYSIPRDGKMLSGPSVRLAEIMASAYGNLHVGARILGAEEREIHAQGIAWDLEKNLRVTVEVARRIVGKTGKRFGDDMIQVTGMAAASIALRNAVFRVVPRSYVQVVYDKCRAVAVGDATTLAARRAEVIARLGKLGVPPERVMARLGVKGAEDIGLEQLETLIGLGTAVKTGEQSLDEAFPPLAPAPVPAEQDGRRIKIGKGKAKQEPKEERPGGDEPSAALGETGNVQPEPGSDG